MVEDIHISLHHINRIARKAILVGLDRPTDDYIKNAYLPVYDHSQLNIPNTLEDYFILGWTSPTLGTPIYTRMIYAVVNQENDDKFKEGYNLSELQI